jgi:beta-alanine degradation protein BauB
MIPDPSSAHGFVPDCSGFDWPDELKEDFRKSGLNGAVGKILVSESDRVRVWSLTLAPGERIGFHKHVLDYFWTAVTPGSAISHMDDGTRVKADYQAGSTKHHHYGPGEFKIHDLVNVGTTELVFTTVEFLDSDNAPLDLPDALRA